MAQWRGSRRGAFRGTGRGGIALFNSHEKRSPVIPTGKLISCLTLKELQLHTTDFVETARISNVSLLTSFSWVCDTRNPTILIPGEPPQWTPLPEAKTLSQDSGQYFRDQNAARYPAHPMEPTAIAILESDQVEQAEIDLVACGSTLGNLLRFATSQAKPFRILVETVGGTTFLVRREKSPDEIIKGVFGYGHTFPEANTTWSADVKGSESHQRVLQYSFGGRRVIVRYEGDACLTRVSPDSQHEQQKTVENDHADVESLASALADGRLSADVKSPSQGHLQVRRAGKLVSQQDMIDIKTRSVKKKDNRDTLAEELPRFWVRQIPTFVLAHHTSGRFDDVVVRNVQAEVEKWEDEHQPELSLLAALLESIIQLVRDHSDQKLELCYNEVASRLEVCEQLPDAGTVLSDEVRARWLAGSRKPGSGSFSAVEDPASHTDVGALQWDAEIRLDYTACTEACEYCGRCTY